MEKKGFVLVVDDDKPLLKMFSFILEKAGYESDTAACAGEALSKTGMRVPDVVILDLVMPGVQGMSLLEKMRSTVPRSRVIMLTGHGDVEEAVKAMRSGAFDFLKKPVEKEILLAKIERAFEDLNLRRELDGCREKLEFKNVAEQILGKSDAILKVVEQARLVGPTTMSVILQGESGTGKELVAKLIHQASHRRDKPFIPVDSAAIPEQLAESVLFGHEKGAFTSADAAAKGLFEHAHSGTIFLDEITNMPPSVQAKLLRVVQERQIRHIGGGRNRSVDVRVIAASNVNLNDAVQAGKFRADLFHRLGEFVITLPSLRERVDDIPILVQQFLKEANIRFRKSVKDFSSKALKKLFSHKWPGNVRELKHVVHRSVLLAVTDIIGPDNIVLETRCLNDFTDSFMKEPGFFSADSGAEPDFKERVSALRRDVERGEIEKALTAAGGNKSKAARLLNVHRSTLYAKL